MAKQAIYEDQARRWYVEEGLSLDAIVGMLDGKVSRKTLFNWKEKYEWDAKRKTFLEHNEDRKSQVIALERQLFNEVKANPTSKNIKRWLLLLAAVDKYGTPESLTIQDETPEQGDKTKQALPQAAIDYIQSLYGLNK